MSEPCEQCDGGGWQTDLTDAEGHTFVRPCSLCRPAVYARWREGHMDPDHTCAECSVRRPLKSAPKPFERSSNEPPPAPPVEAFERADLR